jgi:hypothetical protein
VTGGGGGILAGGGGSAGGFAHAIGSCRLRNLREVLEFLLDLAVPKAGAVGR